MALLAASGVSVPSPAGGARPPLAGPVDLLLRAGEVLGVRGPSGSGKTTLLRSLCLLEPMATGEVRFAGAPVEPADVPAFRRAVVYLPQLPPPMPMTVGDSLSHAFGFKSARKGKRARKGPDGDAHDAAFDAAEAEALCRRLALPDDVLGRFVPDLSVGEAQRVALVRALLTGPRVLLLDEFTSALDAASRQNAEALVREWLAFGDRAAVLVSHDPEQVSRLATRHLDLPGQGSAGGGP